MKRRVVTIRPETSLVAALRSMGDRHDAAEQRLRPSGFGMLIARQVGDELVYNQPGNDVLLVKHLD